MELESVILVWVYYSSLIFFLKAEFAVIYAYPYRWCESHTESVTLLS
jgi:uncharacterized BrkB/YihY/UPF0761 family membrane protein